MPPTLETGIDPIALANRTSREFPDQVTLHELFETRVRQHPTRPALFCDHDKYWGVPSLSYAGLNARANQVARRLREAGVARGQIIGIMTERSFAMIIGIYAILKAGAAYLPLSPDDPPDRLAYTLTNAGVKLLLVHTATMAKAPLGMAVLHLEQPETYTGPDNDSKDHGQPADLAYVIYTSGSTGKPKGVMIEHRSVVNRLHWMQSAYPINQRDVLLQKTSYCFDVSVWELFWWALEGAALCLLAPRAERFPQVLIETIRKHRVSVLHFVPSMLNVFLEYLDGRPGKVTPALDSLRRVFASGEALNPAHARKFNEIIGGPTGARLTNLYGPTEVTVDATYYDCPAEGEIERVPIGRPIQNIRAYILCDGRQASVGEEGELCLAGIGVARGYLNNPQLTRERFLEHSAVPGERIYRTGDLARWLPDGNIEYLGREDHQVKIRGLRIELGEIETNILGFPGIADCVATTKKFSESIVMIVAYLVCKQPVDLDALKKHLHRYLPNYMVPGHFERIDSLPLNSNGKVDRRVLPEPVIRAGGA
ncbi:MAG TPA: amino acid adenylation domain-containing protein [Verrucomicrobiae bacterium]|nr:amino acid adenylation domain-containing protein [Verrucomicrobiae bacterium]